MASILPLPPAIAYGLPWRMVFPTNRPPALLERFASPDFVASLTPDEHAHSETVITALLSKLLASHQVPKTLARAQVNRATSEILWKERSPAGLKVTVGTTRYSLVQALVWVGDSVNRLIKALRPDPEARQPEYQRNFDESEWIDIGIDGAPAAGPRGPKPGSPPVRRPAKLNLVPPASSAERRKRQDESFRLRSKSGHVIKGNDHRLGWLLFEAHKVVSLNRPELLDADHVIGKLSRSIIPGAADLAKVFETQLEAVETVDVTQEIRWVLRELLANTTAPGPWTEESLLWAFGVSEDGKFDPHFWSAAASPSTLRLRRKLVTITGPFLAATFYSPALAEMADHLTSLGFMGARHLQTRLAPVIGDSHIVGVAKFMTDVFNVKLGRMDNVPILVDGRNYDLFYWNQDVKTVTVLEVCEFARDETAARGAFRFEHIAHAFGDSNDGLRKELLLREILNEWSAVRWLDEAGYGVVIGASPIVDVVEHMLHVAWPRSLSVETISHSLYELRAPPAGITFARKRLEDPVPGFVEDEVLLEALAASGRMRRVGRASVALKHKPNADYWAWRPVERDLIDYLRSVGGAAKNRAIYEHFKTDKSVEPHALRDAMRALPYLHVPKMQWTALWHWAT